MKTRWLLHSINVPKIDAAKGVAVIDNGRGRLFCKTLLPAGAKMGQVGGPEKAFVHKTRRGKELARWQSGKNQLRTAEVLDDGRVQFVSDCWYVRYRLASGRMRRQSTGCRDRQAAEKVLADILAKVEKVKAGVMSQDEVTAAGQQQPAFSPEMLSKLPPAIREQFLQQQRQKIMQNQIMKQMVKKAKKEKGK